MLSRLKVIKFINLRYLKTLTVGKWRKGCGISGNNGRPIKGQWKLSLKASLVVILNLEIVATGFPLCTTRQWMLRFKLFANNCLRLVKWFFSSCKMGTFPSFSLLHFNIWKSYIRGNGMIIFQIYEGCFHCDN